MLFINGDSHSAGTELDPKQGYADILAEKLNFSDVINLSVGGASNDRILRTTDRFLIDCDLKNSYPKFIIIGWSECNRQDWFYKGKYYSLKSSDDIRLNPDEVDKKRAEYSLSIFQDMNFIYAFTKYFHEKIYNLHLELNYRNIPHLFFNAVKSYSTSTIINKLMHYDWNNQFWEPYSTDGSFLEWGIKNNYKPTIWRHLNAQCHKEFAELLYNYIIIHNLLSCPSDN